MSLNRISDYKPLIVVDVGTDTTKYSQSQISTYVISNLLKDKQKLNTTDLGNFENIIQSNILDTDIDNLDYQDNNDMRIYKKISKDEKILESPNNKETNNNVNKKSSPNINDNPSQTPTLNATDSGEKLYNINPNTIFDTEFFIKSFPTILASIKLDNFQKNILDYKDIFNYYNLDTFISKINYVKPNQFKLNLNMNFNGEKSNFDLNSFRFPFEPIYSGIIHDYEGWHTIIDSIGQSQLGLNYFNSGFSETPIVITQNSLKFDQLQKQVRMQYEVLFEDFKCPYILICSSAITNLFSYNETTGIVVDIGESGTTISTVVNGFTQYDNSIHIPFISGRSISAMMALTHKNDKKEDDLINFQDITKQYSLEYSEYLEAKFLKESEQCKPFLTGNCLGKAKTKIFNTEVNFNEISTIPYLMFYPEIFKTLINNKLNSPYVLDKYTNTFIKQNHSSNFIKLSSFSYKENFDSVIQFLLPEKNNSVFDSQKQKYNVFSPNNFAEKVIWPYRENESVEKDVLITETSLFNSSYITKNFRQLGLAHILIAHIHKMIKLNPDYSKQLLNVYFTGGVLKTPNITRLIREDIESMLTKKNINLFFPQKDPQFNFYKGANYFSKIPELENIMISRKDYFEFGSEQLSYNYI